MIASRVVEVQRGEERFDYHRRTELVCRWSDKRSIFVRSRLLYLHCEFIPTLRFCSSPSLFRLFRLCFLAFILLLILEDSMVFYLSGSSGYQRLADNLSVLSPG